MTFVAGQTGHVAEHNRIARLSSEGRSYTPGDVGGWYMSPLVRATRALAPTLNRLILHPFFSGADGLTIDQLDVVTTIAAGAGGICRTGIYQITNQDNPFSWSAAAKWADLLVAATSIDTTTAAGQKTVTLGAAQAISANIWFAVGGAEQVAAATRNVGGTSGGAWWTPFGNTTAGGYVASPGIALYMDSVSGALPTDFIAGGLLNVDSGVGIHRSV